MRIGGLFSGIGGLELGLERAGVGHTVWQVEQDAWCRSVLAQHWPEAERFDDVCNVGAHNLSPVEVICGGFPCQDISKVGRGAGLDGARSGLFWGAAADRAGAAAPVRRPRNVAAIRTRGPLSSRTNWPSWGMIRSGVLCRPPTWGRLTSAPGGSVSRGGRPHAPRTPRTRPCLRPSGRGRRWWGGDPGGQPQPDHSLNPNWVEALMGFPGWTAGPPVQAKSSTHGSRRAHGPICPTRNRG